MTAHPEQSVRASYLLIVNPVAGKGAGAARADELRGLLAVDHDVELVQTTGRGDATRLAREHGGRVDRVIAVGGDGTLNEVLAGVLDLGTSAETRPALGFLPGGTANVATQAFGFSALAADAAGALPGTAGRLVDVCVAEMNDGERPFLLWCGAGIDAVVIDELNSARTGHMGVTGLALNAPRVLSAVARYPAPELHVTVDDVELAPVASVILANVSDIAFGGTVHAGATPFDGEVDVVTVEQVGPVTMAAMSARMFLSSLTNTPGVEHRVATTVTIRTEGTVPVQIDGEPVGRLPVKVRVESGAVRLLVPPPESQS